MRFLKSIFPIFIIFAFVCGKSIEPELTSPSGTYRLQILVGDRVMKKMNYRIAFKLMNRDGVELDYIDTHSSDATKWAVTWSDDKTLVLHSHDIGDYAWRVNSQNKLAPINLTPEMTRKGYEAFNQKYPSAKHPEGQ